MDELNRLKILHALTTYDRKQSTRKGHNPYALAHYAGALARVSEGVDKGQDLREAILNWFVGPLADLVLKSVGLAPRTQDEKR